MHANNLTRSSLPLHQLQHTVGHLDCPACEAGRVAIRKFEIRAEHTFSQAAVCWLEFRYFPAGATNQRYVPKNTLRSEKTYISALARFFRHLPLQDVHVGHIREYQRQRASGELGVQPEDVIRAVAKQFGVTVDALASSKRLSDIAKHKIQVAFCEVSGLKINQEIGFLQRLMKRAGCWTTQLQDDYQPLEVFESDLPRSLSPEEQVLWLETAASRERWQLAYWYSILAIRTTAHTNELRGVRLQDLNLYSRTIAVQPSHAKNKYRVRTIPLEEDAYWAGDMLLNRARSLGARDLRHYLMPFRVGPNNYDITRPMSDSGLKRVWDEVRQACGLTWFQPHGLRHTGITRLAESGTPIPVILSMAGHVSQRMQQHYTQISQQAQRMAMDAAKKGGIYGFPPQSMRDVGNAVKINPITRM